MQLSRFCLAGMLSLVAAGASAGTVGIHKCTGSDGKVSYQQHACAVQQRAEVVVVEGEIDADRKAEADAIAKINRITPPPRMAPGEQQLAQIEPEQKAPVRQKAQCPRPGRTRGRSPYRAIAIP